MLPRMHKLTPEFSFAGFAFPRYIVSLSSDRAPRRLELRKFAGGASGYYHKPKPNNRDGIGFYLESRNGAPFELRWKWANDVEGTRIDHTGWFCDDYQDTKVRGVVFRLPHGRGFLAGWSMGEGMASSVDFHVYAKESDAAYAADRLAERVAEDEREYRANECEYFDEEDNEE